MSIDVTRGEFDMLRQMVADNQGVGIVQAQLVDLAKDMTALSVRMDRHEQEHRDDARERSGNRWKAIGLAVALIGPLYPLLLLIHH